MGNPFSERPPFKKRLVNVSLTEAQHEAFLKLQSDLGCAGSGALIKRLLREEIDRQGTRQSPTELAAAHTADLAAQSAHYRDAPMNEGVGE